MSPLPEVRSHREPMRSVSRRGVVPSLAILPTRSASFCLMAPEMACFRASPLSSA